MSQTAEAIASTGTVAALEATPMTIGLAIIVVLGICSIVGAVWTVATVRANDKAAMSKEISDSAIGLVNAIGRVEKKVDANHEQVHGRQNEAIKSDVVLAKAIGRIEGKQELSTQILIALMVNSLKG